MSGSKQGFPHPEAGHQFEGRYELRKFLGEGSVAKTFSAYDSLRRQEVVIKILNRGVSRDAYTRVLNDLCNMNHEALVKVSDWNREDGWVYWVEEFMEFPSLAEMIQDSAKRKVPLMDWKDWLAWLKKISAGLESVSSHDMHGGLHPFNLWMGINGEAKVSDFGLHQLQEPGQRTATSIVHRTLQFLPPELVQAESTSPAGDQFSLAYLTYVYFARIDPERHAGGGIQHKDLKRTGLPVHVTEALTTALFTRPEARFGSLNDFVEALESGGKGAFTGKGLHWKPGKNVQRFSYVTLILLFVLGLSAFGVHTSRTSSMEEARSVYAIERESVSDMISDVEGQFSRYFFGAKANFYRRHLNIADKDKLSRQLIHLNYKANEISTRFVVESSSDFQIAIQEIEDFKSDYATFEQEFRDGFEALDILAQSEAETAFLSEIEASNLMDFRNSPDSSREIQAKLQSGLFDVALTQSRQMAGNVDQAIRTFWETYQEKIDACYTVWDDYMKEKRLSDIHPAWIDSGMRDIAARSLSSRDHSDNLAVLKNNFSRLDQMREELESIRPMKEGGAEVENSIGMRFVPGGTIYFSVWETRLIDYYIFMQEHGVDPNRQYLEALFLLNQGPTHPVTNVETNGANLFCEWLTRYDASHGGLCDAQTMEYRLPTDLEWSMAVGLPRETGDLPYLRMGQFSDHFPWGHDNKTKESGNYYSNNMSERSDFRDFKDLYDFTTPAGTFAPNPLGIFDMGGNVWERVSDRYFDFTYIRKHGSSDKQKEGRNSTLRGGSFKTLAREKMRSDYRFYDPGIMDDVGFRVVLAPRQNQQETVIEKGDDHE